MSTARRRATYQDVVEAPEHLVAELIDGELITSPRPASPHALAASAMSMDLSPFHQPPGAAGKPGGWWILYEPELHFGDDVLVPDLAGWRRKRMPEFPNVAWFAQAPDWACEALSPSTRSLDRDRKMPIYAREGIGHLWLVDPLARTLEVYRLAGGRWPLAATHQGGALVRAEPFEALELDMRRWWGEA